MATRTHPEAAATAAPPPPQNLDAEESVLGACLLSDAAIENVAAILDAGDFYRPSHARIYRALVAVHSLGQPADPTLVADRITDPEDKQRVHQLAALVPDTSRAPFWARLVTKEAVLRRQQTIAVEIGRRTAEGIDPAEIHAYAVAALEEIAAHTGTVAALQLATHEEILQLELAAERELVEDLIPAGAVGTIAAVPEAHKSWLALQIAVAVARGQGHILGKPVVHQGPVAYLWQDDSTREEAERIKQYQAAHPHTGDQPIHWGLNTNVQLPRDLARLKTTVTTLGLVLLVIDSYYNFLPGIDLKDEAAEQIVSQLKREICDTTGATVLIVDHMPWATEQNRQRLRAYGGVFKNAATRFGIYIDAVGDKLHIEARGNNIKGINRRLAYWDDQALELRLVTETDVEHEDLLEVRATATLEWLEANKGRHTTSDVRKNVHGGNTIIDEALELLLTRHTVRDLARNGEAWSGRRGDARYWIASIHAPQPDTHTSPQLFGRGSGEVGEVQSESGEDEASNLAPTRSGEAGEVPETTPPATQYNLAPKGGSPPLRGEPSGGEVWTLENEPRPEPRPDQDLDELFGAASESAADLPTDEKKGAR